MPAHKKVARCGVEEARQRLAVAQGYLDAAKMVLREYDRLEYLSVASGNAVLAGIAASDSICCIRRGHVHRGTDHAGAVGLLAEAVPDGRSVSGDLRRLLTLKDEAHYGVVMTSTRKSRDAVKWADRLVARAREELER
jgi:hypothetical protein